MAAKKILILGGGGFLGSHIAEAFLPSHQVRIFDRKSFSRHNIAAIADRIEIVEGDFHNMRDYEALLQDVGVVIDLVWSTLPAESNKNCVYDLESNVVPFVHFLDCLKERPNIRVVFMSSGGTVYGNQGQEPLPETAPTEPLCAYGITKLMAEKYLALYERLYGLDYRVVRLANPYGERQSLNQGQGFVMTAIQRTLLQQTIDVWGNGSVVRDYIYIADVVSALCAVAEHRGSARIFNIASQRGYSLLQVIDVVQDVLKIKGPVRMHEQRAFDVPCNILNCSLAKAELGWQARITLAEGVTKTAQWLKTRIQR